MKKRYFSFLLILGLLLSGCSKEEMLKPNTEDFKEVKDVISYRFKELVIDDEMRARLGKSMDYKPLDNSKKFLDIVLEVESLASNDILVSDIFEGSKFIINEKEFNIYPFTEENNFSSISKFSYLTPQSSTFVHLVSEVKTEELPDVFNLELVIDKKKVVYEVDRSELKPKTTSVNKGDVITYEDNYQLTFIDFELNKKVEPTDTSSFYSYYQAKGNNTYAIVKMEVLNQSTNDVFLHELINISLLIDEKYKYSGFTAIDRDGNLSTNDIIEPMQQVLAYSIIEIPEKMKENKIEFKVNTADKTYSYLLNN